MKVILLNGPPRCGKNTAADMIRRMSSDCEVIGFAHYLKRMVHSIYLGEKGWGLDPDHYDAVKDQPHDDFWGLTPRRSYIHYSENVIKPLHGPEWFGHQFVRSARDSGRSLIVVPDSGFRQEAERVVREVGAENVLLIRLRKQGCTYDGDSRSYISLSDLGVREFDAENHHGLLSVLRSSMASIVRPWLWGVPMGLEAA